MRRIAAVKRWLGMTAFAALLANAPVRADEPAPEAALAELEALVGASDTLRGRFEQRLVDEIGNVQSVSAGTIEVRRPGRFRWHYLEPYEQIIVGDGAIVWLYDVDLDQVTATRVDEALASSPAALLGGGALSEAFEPVAAHQREGLDWVVLEPLVDDSDFERVVVGYDEEGVRQMRLTDALGQVTEIEFLDVERDVDLPSGRFEFTPPPGVDVIGPDKP